MAGEAVTVGVQLTNPLGILLVISRLSILAHLQQPDHLQGADGSILVRFHIFAQFSPSEQ